MEHFYVQYPDHNTPFCPTAASWYNPYIGSLKTKKHQELQKKYNELEAQKNALEKENTAVNKLKDELDEKNTALNKLKDELEEKNTALNEQEKRSEEKITLLNQIRLEEKNTALNEQKKRSEKKITLLNQNVNLKEDRIESLEKQIEIERKQKEEMEKQIEIERKQKEEMEKQIEIERKQAEENIIRDRKRYFRLNMAAARYFWLEYHQVSLKWKKTPKEPDTTYTEITGENMQKLEETLKRRFEYQDIVCLQEEELIQFSISDPFKKLFIKSGQFYYVTLSLQMGDGHKELLCKKINQQILNAAYNSLCSWALRGKLQKLQEELEYKQFQDTTYDLLLHDFVESIQQITHHELSDYIDKIDSEERDFYYLLCQIYFGMSLLQKIALKTAEHQELERDYKQLSNQKTETAITRSKNETKTKNKNLESDQPAIIRPISETITISKNGTETKNKNLESDQST